MRRLIALADVVNVGLAALLGALLLVRVYGSAGGSTRSGSRAGSGSATPRPTSPPA